MANTQDSPRLKWFVQTVRGRDDFETALNRPPHQYILHSWQFAIHDSDDWYTILWRDQELM